MRKGIWRQVVALGVLANLAGAAQGFTFVKSNLMNADMVVHVNGYTGLGGHYEISVGINPTSANALAMVTPTLNAISTWNRLQPTASNVTTHAIGGSQIDYESVLLHELGHTLGLDHPNQADRDSSNARYAASTRGSDGVFQYSAGADGKAGTADDLRSDDVNLNWFQKNVNDPWTLPSRIDTTTYSRDLADLPSGQTYAAVATRENSSLSAEAVMVQGAHYGEAQRSLTADDVAGVRFAMAGLDGLQGTSDDYTFSLVYAGLTTAADITLNFISASDLAFASFSLWSLGSLHYAANDASISFGSSYDWFFNSVPIPEPASLVLLGLGTMMVIPAKRKRGG